MSQNLTQVKAYLGKYYPELLYSSGQDKYKDTALDTIFDQKFYIQNNKVQMVVESLLPGLTAIVSGNEIRISKDLYNHPNVIVSNSLEKGQKTNPRSMYTPETFSTLAYLMCQNHTMLQIVGEIDEPIYIKYCSDFEAFYSSVIIVEIADNLDIELIEEIESSAATNTAVNYLLNPHSKLKLTTFYNNNISATSLFYRNIVSKENSEFSHIVLGKASASVLDETEMHLFTGASAECLGLISADKQNFHSVLTVVPESSDYSVNVDYRNIVSQKANVSFFPVIVGQHSTEDNAKISVTSLLLDELPETASIKDYTADIIGRVALERMIGVKRFYNNKSKFTDLL